MLTHCPACGTTFRVTPVQLKARSGRVRCGACQRVFDALETLAEEKLPPAPAVPEAEPAPASAPASEPSAMAEALVEVPTGGAVDNAAEAPGELADEIPAEPAEDMPAELVAVELPVETIEPPAEATELPVAAIEPAAEHVEAAAAELAPIAGQSSREAWTEQPAGSPAEIAPTPPTPLEDEPPPEPTALAAEDAAAIAGASETAADDVATEAAAEIAPAAGEGFVEAPEATAPRTWPWLLGACVALLALVGQAVLHFRTEIATLYPDTRPLLASACDALGCDLPRPRKPELVGIEASELTTMSDGRLALAATLKNRAPFAQEYPYLELTLTDTGDRPLVRRALPPAEYLPARMSPAAGFAARAEIAVNLAVAAPDLGAAGYRLYLFYP